MLPLSAEYATILPLSKRSMTENSFFNIGEESNDTGITNIKLPKNTKAAIIEIYASGTAKDEFWYTNFPDAAFQQDDGQASDLAYPQGPLREIQITIDGKLSGIIQPFPVIFTGGISVSTKSMNHECALDSSLLQPFLWRPQVAYGAFDQPTYYIDVSPFLGSLTDDQEHEFRLNVVSAERNQSVLSWFISGQCFSIEQEFLD